MQIPDRFMAGLMPMHERTSKPEMVKKISPHMARHQTVTRKN